MKDNFFNSKTRSNKQTYTIKSDGVFNMVGNFTKKTRKRLRGRLPETFNNKLTKLQSQYKNLFKKSQKSKEIFNNLSEEEKAKILKKTVQNRNESKPFFCDKYITFEDFLKTHNLKQIGTVEPKVKRRTVDRKALKKSVWGY